MNPIIEAAWERSAKPSLRQRKLHSHNTHEIYLFLTGEADYRVEGTRYPLRAGDLVLMRKGEVHIPHILGAVPYERMHVNFDLDEAYLAPLLSVFNERPLGQYNHFPAALFPDNRWQKYMEQICSTEDPLRRYCYLLPLLSDLQAASATLRHTQVAESEDTVTAVIRHINRHLAAPLSLEALCERFYISKTHLNRLFKQTLGTTVWEYVTLKRLTAAREMLSRGHHPTEICADCGFGDYSTFYRAYKKHFGESPSRK